MRITIPQLLAACAVALLCVSAASATLTPLESTFLSTTSASGARSHLQFYTSIDHVAGTPGDFATAQYTQQVLQGYGLQADIISFRTLLNYPINRSLELISAPTYTASLEEDIYPQDPTSDNHWRNLTFHGYGASGDVTGELVYANYGSYEDFQLLQEAGIDFSGKIVLTRYGRVFRGLKVQNAEAFGAIGCLIYSDPADDGFVQGTVYPDGPWRPKSGVQRGSVQFLSRCSGDPGFIERDPTICGYPTSELIPNIPSLPLSWGDALPLLQQMGGMAAPSSAWVGGLNVSYSVGPGPATVHLTVHHEYGVQELWNVVATIPGSHPDPAIADQQVLLSNHRDAWVYGSTDPNSGTAALLEIARGLGALLAGGWQPQRTIKLLSWDGEEYGLLGSTNYAESNAKDLIANAVAFLNVDVAVTGSELYVDATPSLAALAISAASDIIDPNTNKTLLEVWNPTGDVRQVGVLGSGSDFASFLHHLGVAALDMGFNGPYGVYHSVYDSFYWSSNFGDPTFVYHRAMAQLWGLMALRIADARVLPLKFSDYASALSTYITTVEQTAQQKNVTGLNFQPLENAVLQFQSPAAIAECYRVYVTSNSSISESELTAFSVASATLERAFIIDEEDNFDGNGLPSRPWYKHIIQAPGLDTGYDANVFPSLSDALDRQNATAAQIQIGLISAKLLRAVTVLEAVAPYVPEGCTFEQDVKVLAPAIALE